VRGALERSRAIARGIVGVFVLLGFLTVSSIGATQNTPERPPRVAGKDAGVFGLIPGTWEADFPGTVDGGKRHHILRLAKPYRRKQFYKIEQGDASSEDQEFDRASGKTLDDLICDGFWGLQRASAAQPHPSLIVAGGYTNGHLGHTCELRMKIKQITPDEMTVKYLGAWPDRGLLVTYRRTHDGLPSSR
jgi:hypothetical protein